ncbi:PEP-CTERM sorting domain-containing protein [Nitrosomonas sp.]|uniref:PEP-CTERM sorting domain-containing protein n=1 Tax=Nitrosomonas sp. TaxID=42353 RepID=UPI0025ECCE07|nr:PEP-CTERM sorting domain-containing protein [Nitrosomonas sp.]
MKKLNNMLSFVLLIIGISMSGSALAEINVFGFSNDGLNTSNGLNITTNSGDFFLPISDSGWWTSSKHETQNKNYIAGTCFPSCSTTDNHNNFFTFDFSDISETITSASLTLFTYSIAGRSVDYQLFDITSALSEVRATGTNPSVYNDLMTGVSYGSFIYNPSDRFQFRSILLNADGILALNSAIGGEFGIGGTVASGIDGIPLPPIPEPETYAMWLAGLGLLGFLGYRRRIKAVNPLFVSSIAH